MIKKLGGRKVALILLGVLIFIVAYIASEKMTATLFVSGVSGLILGYVTGNVVTKFSKGG